jgi:choline dehydrogenase-like flavoprotein
MQNADATHVHSLACSLTCWLNRFYELVLPFLVWLINMHFRLPPLLTRAFAPLLCCVWRGGSGCSSINGMVYQRGNRADYDGWGVDNPGWSWKDVFPAFRNMIDFHAGETPDAGVGGEWRVETQRVSWDVLKRFASAVVEQGIPMREHLLDSNEEGVGFYKVNQRAGVRLSAYRAFVSRVRHARPNLEVVTNAQVTRLIVEDGVVLGVEFVRGGSGEVCRVEPTAETVLCAGAVGSPHILQVI